MSSFMGDKILLYDFCKKRHAYGTIMVEEETYNRITLLDGRDGSFWRK